MTRLTAAVIVMFCLLAPAGASLERPKPTKHAEVVKLVLPKGLQGDTTEVPPPPEAQLTAETEVFLDGRRCAYKDIPPTASITRMVLAEDGKTITRVEFSAKK